MEKKSSNPNQKVDMANPQVLDAILTVCKSQGVREFSVEGLTVTFFPSKPVEEFHSKIDYSKILAPDPDKAMPTEEELLGWSTSIDLSPEIKK